VLHIILEKNEMAWACGTYGGRKRCAQGVGGGNLMERGHWGEQDVGGRIILREIFGKWERVCGDWMELAQDRDRWRALVSTVMNCGVVGTGWSWHRIGTDGGRL
jgi:hypothetical protein